MGLTSICLPLSRLASLGVTLKHGDAIYDELPPPDGDYLNPAFFADEETRPGGDY